MGVVGSIPSPSLSSSSSTLDNAIKVSPKENLSPSAFRTYSDMIIDETDSNTNSSFSSSNTKIHLSNTNDRHKSRIPLNVKYGPLNIKVRRTTAPTLATGRRSKFFKLEGDAAIKREIRRKRNRDAAQKLKEKRETIEQGLFKQIEGLETEQKQLLETIKNLQSYKEYLERQWQLIISTKETFPRFTSSTLKHAKRNRRRMHRNVPIYHSNVPVKTEPCPPSPQWQLLFSI